MSDKTCTDAERYLMLYRANNKEVAKLQRELRQAKKQADVLRKGLENIRGCFFSFTARRIAEVYLKKLEQLTNGEIYYGK